MKKSEEVIREMLPALAAAGGAAARAAAPAIARGAAAAARPVAKAATKAIKGSQMASKLPDVARIIKALNRINVGELMKNIDKPLEVQDLIMNVLGTVTADPRVIDAILSKIKTQMRAKAKQSTPPATAAQTEPVGQPPAEE